MKSRWFVAAFAAVLGVGLTPSCSSSSSGGYVLCSEAGTCPTGYECQSDVCVQVGAGGAAGSGTGGGGGSVAGSGGSGATGGAGGSSSCSAGVDCSGCTACYDSCICTGAASDQCLTVCSATGGAGGGSGGVGATGGVGGTGGAGATGGTGGFGGTGGTGGFSGTGGVGGTGGTGGFSGTGGVGGTGGTGGALACTEIFQPSVCTTCIETNCCIEAEDCFNGLCGEFYQCFATYCSAAADPNACAQTNCASTLGGIPAFNTFSQCLTDWCTTDCG